MRLPSFNNFSEIYKHGWKTLQLEFLIPYVAEVNPYHNTRICIISQTFQNYQLSLMKELQDLYLANAWKCHLYSRHGLWPETQKELSPDASWDNQEELATCGDFNYWSNWQVSWILIISEARINFCSLKWNSYYFKKEKII